MAYHIYLDKLLLPVAPAKMTFSINNQNASMTLINDGEITVLKQAGLTAIEFVALLPNVPYPFAIYKHGFEKAKTFIDQLEQLKRRRRSFQFKVVRRFPDDSMIFDTNMTVSLESYTIVEDAENAFDLMVKISLKQYKHFGTKTCQVTFTNTKPIVSATPNREESSSPAPTAAAKSHTVVAGDCLWAIAKKYYGNGARYPEIYTANKSTIDGKNKGTGNPKYTIYPRQVFTIPV